ncbi:fibrinogen-like YCDxxxxGGGW domain-containing protein [Archangium lipolyticum]|uniref:fibrinogen-like YCDxxxxGGGW domain-containing protein n=1 Tax=Archangium lipolyticum TaxID=2970465 RepID=UPI00214A5333|nr:fibrinogen-like YCDxxxxGGGW domain-containing protein [Archangium lipolyticum]
MRNRSCVRSLAAAFALAALSGCPHPPPEPTPDAGTLDAGTPVDGGSEPEPDAGTPLPEIPRPGSQVPPRAKDPAASCQEVKARNPSAPSDWYWLDPCGTQGARQALYYCEMDRPGSNGARGGWTVAGWQPASAITTLGVERRDTPSAQASNWSSSLECLSFREVMIFNKTTGAYFTDSLPGEPSRVSSVPYALGVPGHSFNQGRYGPDSPSYTPITQACVGFSYNGALSAEWACVTDTSAGGTARGHVADYALDYNCKPVPTYDPNRAWAWADNDSCSLVGEDYAWGIAVR